MGASLLGIGGGMILGIIFNEIGKMDETVLVMAATAALATALVASTSCAGSRRTTDDRSLLVR
eukprot:gene49308-34589_t